MGQVLVRYTEPVKGSDGNMYAAQACGDIATDGLWEGWIEFLRIDGSVLRTPRETEQPNRDALVYWAEGLSNAYLEGALQRALDALVKPVERISVVEPSVFTGPAANVHPSAARRTHPVLDPFATYAQGESILRAQLKALSRDHLVSVIDGYQLFVEAPESRGDRELVEAIIRAVQLQSSAA